MSTARPSKPKILHADTFPCGRPSLPPLVDDHSPRELLKKLILQLNKYSSETKLNRSEAREKILEVIVSKASHFTAMDLLERLQKRHPDIGKATLYRNLPVLVESGILKEGPHDSNGQILYEISGDDHHDHIVCLDCKRIFEFHDNAIEKRQDQISANLGFTARDHRHVIYAACDYFKKAKLQAKK